MSARALLLLAGLPLLAVSLFGTETASPAEFLRVVAGAPALTAAARRVQAAEERVGAAGQLPDPEVEGMLSRMRGAMGERNDMGEFNVRQPLPKRGERGAQRELARAAVTMADADYAAMLGELAADTAMALAEAESGETKIRCVETQIGRMESVLRVIEARLSTTTSGMGGSRLADRLTLQTRIAAMRLMLEEDRRMIADALAEARSRLGLAPEASLPAFVAPSPAEIDRNSSPALSLAAARGGEAEAMLKMARATANPMTAVGVRFERERTALGDDDTLGIAFMSELPWRGRRTSRAQAKAAAAERSAAQADASVATYRISSALSRVERADRLAESARRLGRDTLTRVQAEYDTLLRAASAGNPGDSLVLMTVELLEKATEAELQVIAAERAARVARAELWRHLPVERLPKPVR